MIGLSKAAARGANRAVAYERPTITSMPKGSITPCRRIAFSGGATECDAAAIAWFSSSRGRRLAAPLSAHAAEFLELVGVDAGRCRTRLLLLSSVAALGLLLTIGTEAGNVLDAIQQVHVGHCGGGLLCSTYDTRRAAAGRRTLCCCVRGSAGGGKDQPPAETPGAFSPLAACRVRHVSDALGDFGYLLCELVNIKLGHLNSLLWTTLSTVDQRATVDFCRDEDRWPFARKSSMRAISV